jgi:uncharacterized protein YndB with AHSA1/START domain
MKTWSVRPIAKQLGMAAGMALLLAVPTAAAPPPDARSIHQEVDLAAPPERVFQLWTTLEGVRRFLAPDARIDPRVGGRYEILFQPDKDPEGVRQGTKGAHILRLEKNRVLAFEWRGREDMAEMNIEPLPTRVELTFEPVAGQPGRTHLSLTHSGFLRGAGWDRSYDFFNQAWAVVLARLKEACAGPP